MTLTFENVYTQSQVLGDEMVGMRHIYILLKKVITRAALINSIFGIVQVGILLLLKKKKIMNGYLFFFFCLMFLSHVKQGI